MKITTGLSIMAISIAAPLLAADLPHGSVEQAGRPSPGSTNTAYTLEINFETGSSVVKPEFDKDIRRVTDHLKNYPGAKCEIRGYTDNVGSDEVNKKLSQERADSVRKYMIDNLGIAPNRLTAKGYGNAEPLASNDSEEGRRQNRRIVAVING